MAWTSYFFLLVLQVLLFYINVLNRETPSTCATSTSFQTCHSIQQHFPKLWHLLGTPVYSTLPTPLQDSLPHEMMRDQLTMPCFKEARNEVVNKLDLHKDHITKRLHQHTIMTSQPSPSIHKTNPTPSFGLQEKRTGPLNFINQWNI